MPIEPIETNTIPVLAARTLYGGPASGVVLFDSGQSPGSKARWSILSCEPAEVLTEKNGTFYDADRHPVRNPVDWLRERSAEPQTTSEMPFIGGLAGFLGFEFAWELNNVGCNYRAPATPRIWVGDYPSAAVYDHKHDQWYLTGRTNSRTAKHLRKTLRTAEPPRKKPTPLGSTSPQLSVSRDTYRKGVRACVDAIYSGQLFEVNYTERLRARWPAAGFALYERMRHHSTGSFFGFLDGGTFELMSVSPEQFLSVHDGRVCTRPIKGTRRRSPEAEKDARLASELASSTKDRAENIMIVDLMRNDLTQICELGTVEATRLCSVESFAGIHHLVSTVAGQLADGFSPVDALLACFPAGSITGAPKLRSIELICSLEHSPRGPYTGSMFYVSRNGRMDSNVLIRTAVLSGDRVSYGTGGAVVSDSAPGAEYEEAMTKARVFEKGLGGES